MRLALLFLIGIAGCFGPDDVACKAYMVRADTGIPVDQRDGFSVTACLNRVCSTGEIEIGSDGFFLPGEAKVSVGLQESDEGTWRVHFAIFTDEADGQWDEVSVEVRHLVSGARLVDGRVSFGERRDVYDCMSFDLGAG